ncbi:vacuolar amino acid transporter 2 [Dipodascopsis tothii]|uniref:vacuolar amino acid transporter 2 n=1 Tax=Dipodascopsis tothii TaxID=44089 RepID=UPI0034CE0675
MSRATTSNRDSSDVIALLERSSSDIGRAEPVSPDSFRLSPLYEAGKSRRSEDRKLGDETYDAPRFEDFELLDEPAEDEYGYVYGDGSPGRRYEPPPLDFGAELDNSPKNGMKMAFMNMANSIIGAGIIGQPYALRQCGLATGVALLVGLTVVIDWTINLMVVNAKLSGTVTYQETVRYCFGKTGYVAISLAQGLFALGGSIAFCVIVGDTIPPVFRAFFPGLEDTPVLGLLTQRNPVVLACILGVSLPLCLSRSIANLAKASALALLSMLIIIVSVIVGGIRAPADLRGDFSLRLLTINPAGVFQGIGVISFAFVCHHNSLLIYGALRKPTLDRFARVTHWSTGISMVACMALGLGGFLVFRDRTQGNVLNNFADDHDGPGMILINIARLCFGLNMLTTLPLEIFVCREVILDFAKLARRDSEEEEAKLSDLAHVVTTVVLVLIALGVALATDSLGIVLELVGSTSACVLAYILPPLCYLKLTDQSTFRRRVAPFMCVSFGVVVMIASTTMTIIKAVRD